MVKEKRIKVYHGLVLRNAIEEMELVLAAKSPQEEEYRIHVIDRLN